MDYLIKSGGMISGIGEVQKRMFKKYIGKSGRTWMVAIQDDSASNIYVSADPKENEPGFRGFRGFGGSTLTFQMEDGSIEELKGPWHSNSDALFHDTGVDIRDRHETFVVVSKGRDTNGAYKTIMVDVLYIDEKPVIGEFDRGKGIAKKYADDLDIPVMLYSESKGGSSCGPEYPTDWSAEKIREYWRKEK